MKDNQNYTHDRGGREEGLTTSVVICTHSHQRRPQLYAAIESVRCQSLAADEIFVVVDRNDALRRALAPHSNITVLSNEGAPGISGARNTGTAAASGAIVAFLDDDARASEDWLHWLLDAYEDDRVLGVGGRIIPSWPQSRPRWFPPELDWVVGCTYQGLPENRAVVRNVIGANMSFRRNALIELSGFASEFGRSGDGLGGAQTAEETDLCLRAGQRFPDGRIVYEPRAEVMHNVSADRITWPYLARRARLEGATKSLIIRRSGRRSLDVERSYLRSTLPTACGRELRSFLAGDLGAAQRIAAIGVALVGAGAGFVESRTGGN